MRPISTRGPTFLVSVFLAFSSFTGVSCAGYVTPLDWHPALEYLQGKSSFPLCVPTNLPGSVNALKGVYKTGGGLLSKQPETASFIYTDETEKLTLTFRQRDTPGRLGGYHQVKVRGETGSINHKAYGKTLSWNEDKRHHEISVNCSECISDDELLAIAESMTCATRRR